MKRLTYKRKKPIGSGWKEEKQVRSGLEAKAVTILDKHKIDYQYEPKDKKLSYIKPAKQSKYLPDFLIGNTIYETKGRFTIQDRQKMILLKEQHPEFNFVMVFQKDQPIIKGSKTLYSDWCRKNGISYMTIEQFEREIITRHKTR